MSAAAIALAAREVVLVFPAGMPASVRYASRAGDCTVIGASSLRFDPARRAYETFEFLPYITDPGFLDALGALIRRRGVTRVYTPHLAARLLLADKLALLAPGVTLADSETQKTEEAAYAALAARVAASPAATLAADAAAPMRQAERVGLVRLIDGVPGMCSEEKILALMDVARCCPRGDIVEIGSWWGKSAALLTCLARRYDIGRVLCLDPWRQENLVQKDEAVDRASAALDADGALRIFEINLAPLAQGWLNYVRAPAHDVAPRYAPGFVAETEAFGVTEYEGRIALLHIDGNHAYESVDEDLRDWRGRVIPGGWIVFDDYVWPFGDGPRRVADEFLARETAETSFVAGGALFVRLMR